MARRATPKHLLQLRGSYRPDRHGQAPEFDLPPADLSAPPWLCDEAKAVWDTEVVAMVNAGVLRRPDMLMAAAVVTSFALWKQSAVALQNMAPHETGYSALSRAVTSLWAAFCRGANELGLSPTSREHLRRRVPEPLDTKVGVDRFVLRTPTKKEA